MLEAKFGVNLKNNEGERKFWGTFLWKVILHSFTILHACKYFSFYGPYYPQEAKDIILNALNNELCSVPIPSIYTTKLMCS